MHISDLPATFTHKETTMLDLKLNNKIKGELAIVYYIDIQAFITEIYKMYVRYVANTKYIYISCGSYVAICERLQNTVKCVCLFEKITTKRFDKSVIKVYTFETMILQFQCGKEVLNYITKQFITLYELENIWFLYLKDAICDSLLNKELGIDSDKTNNMVIIFETTYDALSNKLVPGAIMEKYFYDDMNIIMFEEYGDNGDTILRKLCCEYFEMYPNNSDSDYEENFENVTGQSLIEIDSHIITHCIDYSKKYSQILYIDFKEYVDKLNVIFNKYTSNNVYFYCPCIDTKGNDSIAVCKYVLDKELLCVHIFNNYFPTLMDTVKKGSCVYSGSNDGSNNTIKLIFEVGKYVRYLYGGRKFVLQYGNSFEDFDIFEIFFINIESALTFNKTIIDDNILEIKIESIDEILSVQSYLHMKELWCGDEILHCETYDNSFY